MEENRETIITIMSDDLPIDVAAKIIKSDRKIKTVGPFAGKEYETVDAFTVNELEEIAAYIMTFVKCMRKD